MLSPQADQGEEDNLPILDVQNDGNDEQTVLQQAVTTFTEIEDHCNQKIEGKAFFKNGLMQEICMPSDASVALIEGSGNYMMHLAFYLSIQFFVEAGDEEFFCYSKNATTGIWSRNMDQTTSFLIQSLNELKWAHFICFVLLLTSKIYYFQNVGRFTLDQQGVLRLLTIPLYLTALYRAEYNIRRYRPFYDQNATKDNYQMIISEGCLSGQDCEGGEFCFAKDEGSVYQWLWLELIAFVCQMLVMVFILLWSYCGTSSVSMEPKNPDYILVKDYRDKSDPTKKVKHASLHVLNRELKELWPKGDLFQFQEDDGFGKDNLYKKVADKDEIKADEDFTEIQNILHEQNQAVAALNDVDDQLLGGDDLLEKIKDEKTQQLEKKKESVEAALLERPEDSNDVEAMKAFNMVRFFKVKGADIDSEIREVQDGRDELMHIMDESSQFPITMLFLIITSLYVALAYNITYPSYFDEKLITDVINQRDELNDVARDQCKVRLPESKYAPPLWALFVGQLLFLVLIKCGEKIMDEIKALTYTFVSMREFGIARNFYSNFTFSSVIIVIFYALVAVITFIMLNNVEFDQQSLTQARCNKDQRKQLSIIALWIYTNFVIAALSLPGVLIDFLLAQNKDTQNMRQLIIYSHRNSLKKFYATDSYGSTILSETSTLKGKLTTRLLARKKEGDPFAEDPTEEEIEFKRRERKAANMYRMSKTEVLDEIQRAIDMISNNQDPDCNGKNHAMKDVVDDIEDSEITNVVSDMIKKVNLSASGIYDFVFWEMYHEDNPEYMSGLKLKLCLAFGVHALATYYYFCSIPFGATVYFGGFQLNIIRLIMAILLHLACISSVQGALGMLTFIVANPSKFACGSLLFPSFICIAKIILVVSTEGCAILYLLYTTDELAAIKLAPLLLIVATWDSKLVGIFPTGRSQAEMDSMPLEYIRAGGAKSSIQDAKNYSNEMKKKGRFGQIGNAVLVWVLAVLNFVLGILYNTIYFYFTPFIPMVMVILQSYTKRHSPVIGLDEVPLPQTV